ncbi:hypothetical protein Tco_1089056 [Tanacetum coccineum]
MDDLYNTLKVYEPEVKGTSSSNTSTQNMAFVSINNSDSTNEAVNTTHGVFAVSTQDLQQLHPDDLEEMDLRWQMAMLTMKARSATTAIRGETLLGSVELQETKITGTAKAQEGSDQAEKGPTNYALMAYSSSSFDFEVYSEEESVSQTKIEKKIAKPSFVKIDFVKAKQTNKTDSETAKQVEHNRQNTHTPKRNQINCNNMMS